MRNKYLLEDFLGQRSKVAVLRLLYQESDLTGREIARRTNLSARSAQQALQEFHSKGVVHRKTIGASYLYSLNRERYVVKHMLSPLFESERGLFGAMIKELLETLPHRGIASIILYGSVARGESKQGSDLDVMIVVDDSIEPHKIADLVKEKNSDFTARFGFPLSPYVIGRRTFVGRFDSKDKLIQNVVKEGRVIHGKHFEEILALEPQKASR